MDSVERRTGPRAEGKPGKSISRKTQRKRSEQLEVDTLVERVSAQPRRDQSVLGCTGHAQSLGATAYDVHPKILQVRTTTSPGTRTNRKLLTSKNSGLLKYMCLVLFFF